ncbi:hypothetical protein PCC7424_0282 [Gloeothece citriformis PCC 7424]|uniref:Uncharacterized protein n=1 Tax=Gloeothece citriformis (strain PCC 7424) TaxID=65393 RepID=B7KAS8_GLOC7|nr:hypothetical protein PCC7424_0282 [Gloeothece citriformis PCC 7424]
MRSRNQKMALTFEAGWALPTLTLGLEIALGHCRLKPINYFISNFYQIFV